jgi:hypothetical protein
MCCGTLWGVAERDEQPGDTNDPAPTTDSPWDRAERRETSLQRLDRNWADLLQELRVIQTGVQLLAGFLLTQPFQTASNS